MITLYRLFNTHFQIVTEEEINSFECTQDQTTIKYYAKDFEEENDEMFCSNCRSMFPVKKENREITELFNNSVLDIETKGNCDHCGHFNHSHVRFKRGYAMSKRGDEWICILPKCSLIAEWFYKIKNFLMPW